MAELLHPPVLEAGDLAPLPLPGEKFDGRTVIASVWLNDDYRRDFPHAGFDQLALLLLLEAVPPYFTVTQITSDGSGPWSVVESGSRHQNIVPAVESYQQNGGDW